MDWVNLFEWVQGVEVADLPPAPFETPFGVVVDGGKWLAKLKGDARQGPQGPRARWGAIQSELKWLHGRIYAAKTIPD